MRNTRLDDILAMRNEDGGLPYSAGMPSFAEPTLLTTLACLALGDRDAALQLFEWARRNQNADGSIGLNPDLPHEGTWTTSMFLIASLHLGAEESRRRGIDFILRSRAIPLQQTPEMDLDPSLIGWSWMPGTASWVEPTAWALLALRLAGLGDHPRAKEGRRLLLDRCIPGMGWNYGNKRVFGHMLLPFWDTTALALLALDAQDDATTRPVLDTLESKIPEIHSLLTASWAHLCLARSGRSTDRLKQIIDAALHDARALATNVAHCAVARIALSGKPILWS